MQLVRMKSSFCLKLAALSNRSSLIEAEDLRASESYHVGDWLCSKCIQVTTGRLTEFLICLIAVTCELHRFPDYNRGYILLKLEMKQIREAVNVIGCFTPVNTSLPSINKYKIGGLLQTRLVHALPSLLRL